EGIFWAEEVFGHTLTNSDGRVVPVRFVGEQHVKEDLGWIPTLPDWFKHLRVQPWMARVGDRRVAQGERRPPTTPAGLDKDEPSSGGAERAPGEGRRAPDNEEGLGPVPDQIR